MRLEHRSWNKGILRQVTIRTVDKRHKASYDLVMFVEQPFENRDVVSLVGVTERELRHWTDLKIIVPKVAQAVGRPGVRRKYSFENLVEAGILKTLLRNGLNLHDAGQILRKYQVLFKKFLPGPLYLVVQGETTSFFQSSVGEKKTLVTKLEKLLDPDMDRDAFLVVAIHHIKDRLTNQIQALYNQ